MRRLLLPLSFALKWSARARLRRSLPLDEILKRLKADFEFFSLIFIPLEIGCAPMGHIRISGVIPVEKVFTRIRIILSNIKPAISNGIRPARDPVIYDPFKARAVPNEVLC